MTLRSYEQVMEFSASVPGFYDIDELQHLYKLVRTLPKHATIVEIGVEFGRSASVFLQCPENWSELHLIDDRSHSAVDGRRWTSRLLGSFQSWIPEPVPWKGGTPQAGYGHKPNFMEPYDPWPHFKPPSDEKFQPGGWRPRAMGCEAMPNNMIYDLEISSDSAASAWPTERRIDLLHIDGDHGDGVWLDCQMWLFKVAIGGVAVFHDYLRRDGSGSGDVFPDVTRAVEHYIIQSSIGDVMIPHRWELVARVNTQLSARRVA